jgi:uncharacterized membrane protein YtjA (UPF0391 family)
MGIGIGAVIGVLFAPQSGEDTRDYLRKRTQDRVNDAVDTGKEYARRAQDTLQDTAHDTQELARDVAAAGQRAYREARNASWGNPDPPGSRVVRVLAWPSSLNSSDAFSRQGTARKRPPPLGRPGKSVRRSGHFQIEISGRRSKDLGRRKRWKRIARGGYMLRWALIFLVVAIIAGIFGFAGIMVAAAGIAKLLFYLFLVLFLISLIGSFVRRV